MATTWPEVTAAQEESRHELVLSGPEVAKKVERGGVDSRIFKLTGLNFLEISKAGLKNLSPDICELANLTSLVLHGKKWCNPLLQTCQIFFSVGICI